MFPVSELYKNMIARDVRRFRLKIIVDHSQGSLTLTEEDIVLDSFIFNEGTQSGEEFTIGGTVASDISFTISDKDKYEGIVFMGATITPYVEFLVREEVDAHFIQPHQPSKMVGFEDLWESIPLGLFHVDVDNWLSSTIEIKAIDNMMLLDKPYSLSNLNYPTTLGQIYLDICSVGGVIPSTVNFPNKSYTVQTRPSEDLTLRDILGYVAELSGTFAKTNRYGGMELRWYEVSDKELLPNERFEFKPSDDTLQITGISATVTDEESETETVYFVGEDDYVIDLSENPLLQGDYNTVLPNILANVEDTIFTPYRSEWRGDPAIQAGYTLKQIDVKNNEYVGIITNSTYKYRGKCTLEAKGISDNSRGFKGSTNAKLAEIKRKVDEEVGAKITDLETAQLNATQLISNMLGGYVIETEDALYVADTPNLEQATRVWKWGLGGFGYSENGVNGPYTSAITADGSIVANLITAGIIRAEDITTGTLTGVTISGNTIIGGNISGTTISGSTIISSGSGSGQDYYGGYYFSGDIILTGSRLDLDVEKYYDGESGSYTGRVSILDSGIMITQEVPGINETRFVNFHDTGIIHSIDGYSNAKFYIDTTYGVKINPALDCDNIQTNYLNIDDDLRIWGDIHGRNSLSLDITSNGNIDVRPASGKRMYVYGDLRPGGSQDLGGSSYRWDTVYLSNQPDVSSDVRHKESIQSIPRELLERLSELEPKMYKQNDKWHFGYIAQDIERVLYKYAVNEVGFENAKDLVEEFAVLAKDESYMSLLYGEIAVLREAQFINKIEELKSRLDKLEGVEI